MNWTARAYSEKRNYLRMKIDSPVIVQDQQGHPLTGICRDLSGEGMLIEMEKEYQIGTELDVEIHPKEGNQPLMRAVTEVARVSKLRPGLVTLGLMIRKIQD